MSSHKPLTAAEIEELRELEAKATQGEWRVGELDAHGQPTVSDKYIELLSCWHHSVGSIDKEAHANAALIAAMRNALPRLLSMLAPPTDAEVREAVENTSNDMDAAQDVRPYHGIVRVRVSDLRTLLRAVQAPRLTGERLEVGKELVDFIKGADCLCETHFFGHCGRCRILEHVSATFPELGE